MGSDVLGSLFRKHDRPVQSVGRAVGAQKRVAIEHSWARMFRIVSEHPPAENNLSSVSIFFLLYPEPIAMNSDSPSPEFPKVTYIYDSSGRLLEQREESVAVPGMTAGSETIEDRSTPVAFEHDKPKRLPR
jgi:hypothetical protein